MIVVNILKAKIVTGTNFWASPTRAILDILFYNIYVLSRYPKILEHFHDDYMMDKINYDELFEKELKDSKSIYCNEIIYDRNKEGN